MRRAALILRFFTVLSLALWLSGVASYAAYAQNEGTPPAEEVPTEEPTQEPTEEPALLQGLLTIYVFTCTDGPEGVAGDLLLEGEFTPGENCSESGEASLSIGGGAAEAVSSGMQYTLDEGDYSVDEVNLGESVTVSVAEQVPAVIYAVFYDQPESEAGVEEGGTVSIVKHVCPEAIQTEEDFNAIGDYYAKIQSCLAITLPGDLGPEGSKNGNDFANQLSFDFGLTFDDGNTTLQIDAATFTPEELCESTLGTDINNNTEDDLCLDVSHYAYSGVTQGSVTVTETTPPDGYRYGAVEFVPDSGDDAAFVSTSVETGEIELDTTSDDSVVLHVFNFQEPIFNRVTIVKHECPSEIETTQDFDDLGDFYDKALTCLVITRDDDFGPDGALNGINRTFDFAVEGSDGGVQKFADATFVPSQICESQLGFDLNGIPEDDLCLGTSGYRFDDILQGTGVLITETKAPRGFTYGALEFVPDSGDDAALVDASDDGVIELDTTDDGNVTLHIFNFKVPAEPTPEPSDSGTLQVLNFYCIGDTEETVIFSLAPGAEATSDDLGDESCYAGDADFEILVFGSDSTVESLSVDSSGMVVVSDLPVTDGSSGPHVITELYSGESTDFDIDPDTVTRVIALNYEVEETDEEDEEDEDYEEDYEDEEDIESGEDLAETGFGPAGSPVDGGMVFMLGAMSILVLAGAGGFRRRVR